MSGLDRPHVLGTWPFITAAFRKGDFWAFLQLVKADALQAFE